MDNALIQLVARLKIRLRQDKGISVNTQRFFADLGYAHQMLDLAEESEAIDLVSAALELRNRLGWIRSPGEPTTQMEVAPTLVNAAANGTNTARYKFGARS